MSIVIDFYPVNASKADLKAFVESFGFNKTTYSLNPFPKGTLYYAWYDYEDYKSADGVEAVIIDNKAIADGEATTPYVIHTRTRVWASAYDKQKQNQLIRAAKKRFGGDFYNDQDGKNRYIPIEKPEFLHPYESGILKLYERLKDKLSKLYSTIVSNDEPFELALQNAAHPHIKQMLIQNNPDIYLYNSLLPFAVSVIEHLLKELFIVLIKYDEKAQKLIAEFKVKDFKNLLSVSDLKEIQKGTKSIEELIAGNYTFQNLNQVNDAYKKYLNIDVNSILSKKIYGKNTLRNALVDVIERRHWMIHHFSFSSDMDKKKFFSVLEICDLVIEEMVSYVETRNQIQIKSHSMYSGIIMFPNPALYKKETALNVSMKLPETEISLPVN